MRHFLTSICLLIFAGSLHAQSNESLCELNIGAPICTPNGTEVQISMTNSSNYAADDFDVILQNLNPNDYSVNYSLGAPTSTATVLIDSQISGMVNINALLTSPADEQGYSLWCQRDDEIDIEPCIHSCIDVQGEWHMEGEDLYYEFLVTLSDANSGFVAGDIQVMGLPAGATISPDPIVFVNGQAQGFIHFPGGLAQGEVLALTFFSIGNDLCCELEHVIEVPKSDQCEPEIALTKYCEIENADGFYQCAVELFDKNFCELEIDVYEAYETVFNQEGVQTTFTEYTNFNAGITPWVIGNDQSGIFQSLGDNLPTGFRYTVQVSHEEFLDGGENCIEMFTSLGDFSTCSVLPPLNP